MTENQRIVLFSTLAVRKAFDEGILADFTDATGITVDTVFDPTTQLVKRIERGETFDVMIGISSSFAGLPEGVVDLSTRTPITKTGVGIAVPPGEPLPDISTKEALVKTLLACRSVAYSQTGASGIYFAKLIQELGIADQINEHATIPEKGFIAEAVVDGRADLAIQQLSELAFVPAAQIVGPLPPEVQHYSEFSACLSVAAANNEAARKFVDYMVSDQAEQAYLATGLESIR